MDAKTFDLTDMLTGRNFPTEDVPVYLDETVAYNLSRVEEAIAKDPENEDLEKERLALVEEARKSRFVVTLQGVSRDRYLAVTDAVTEMFPNNLNAFGRPNPNPDADRAFLVKLWALHIKSITNPAGDVNEGVTEEEAEGLFLNLPTPVVDIISSRINDLGRRTREGFETLAMETDFLSQR